MKTKLQAQLSKNPDWTIQIELLRAFVSVIGMYTKDYHLINQILYVFLMKSLELCLVAKSTTKDQENDSYEYLRIQPSSSQILGVDTALLEFGYIMPGSGAGVYFTSDSTFELLTGSRILQNLTEFLQTIKKVVEYRGQPYKNLLEQKIRDSSGKIVRVGDTIHDVTQLCATEVNVELIAALKRIPLFELFGRLGLVKNVFLCCRLAEQESKSEPEPPSELMTELSTNGGARLMEERGNKLNTNTPPLMTELGINGAYDIKCQEIMSEKFLVNMRKIFGGGIDGRHDRTKEKVMNVLIAEQYEKPGLVCEIIRLTWSGIKNLNFL